MGIPMPAGTGIFKMQHRAPNPELPSPRPMPLLNSY